MKKYMKSFAVIVALSTAAFAGTTASNTNTVSPTLKVTATIQSAVQLTLSTGTAAVTHCAVTPGGGADFSMDFGTVDALAINAGNCNKFAPTTPGTTDAIYWSDYNLNPVFTSQAATATPNVKAFVSTNFASNNIYIARSATSTSATVPAAATDFAPMSTTAATPDTIVSPVASGTAATRFIGVGVKPTNGAGLTGAQTATVTFTLTVQ